MLLTIGERLTALQHARKVKGKDLAHRSGVPATTISAIKRGRIPNPGTAIMRALADALDVTLDYMVGMVDA